MSDEPAADVIDRRPSIAFFLSAESFLKTAIHAHQAMEARTLKLRFEIPIYYLYSHAIELTLKAYLRAKGVTAAELATRKWGHDLLKLWSGCFEHGLVLDPITHAAAGPVVDMLAPFATSYEFRYVEVGFRTLPTLDAVCEAAEALHAAIKPQITATFQGPIPERG